MDLPMNLMQAEMANLKAKIWLKFPYACGGVPPESVLSQLEYRRNFLK
jgi:hypothetical protein